MMSPSPKIGPAAAPVIKIVLTGGGSGGHITPLLPLARALKTKQPDCQLIYIGLKGEKIDLNHQAWAIFDHREAIPSGKFRRYHGESLTAHLLDVKTLALNFIDFFKFLLGCWSAYRLLGKYRPNVVFSKGGFVVVPVGVAAKARGVPIITHDSDAVPGLANRIVGRWASLHATGMPASYYKYPKDTVIQTGIPIDEKIQAVTKVAQRNLKRQLDLPEDCLLLLVAGGGLGSRTVNNLIVNIAPRLLQRRSDLRIVHFSGLKHQKQVSEAYLAALEPEQTPRIRVIGFAENFNAYSGAADIVVARAGATTLAELALQRKAAVIIPSPFLAAGHQLKNAEELTTKRAAVVLPNNVTPAKLFNVLAGLMLNEKRREDLAQKLGQLAQPNAAADLASLILRLAKSNK